jgi:DNA-binding NarL/FixJ family response regulator
MSLDSRPGRNPGEWLGQETSHNYVFSDLWSIFVAGTPMALATALAALPRDARPSVGGLPARMQVLHIANQHGLGDWLAEAFLADSASDVRLSKAVGTTAGLSRLRHDVFDAILISHQPGDLDALETVEGIRAAHPDVAIVVLGAQSEQEMSALCFEVDADAYVCVHTATTRALIWQIARAIERHQLLAENRRLHQGEQHRLQLEHQEVQRLLEQQRSLIKNLAAIDQPQEAGCETTPVAASNQAAATPELPQRLVVHYRELLRTHVIMGSGQLTEEMNKLADLLATAEVTARQMMWLHLRVLEELIRGLGNRSARHVMNRADLLVVDVLVHLAERYRQRYLDRVRPPRQMLIPGLD